VRTPYGFRSGIQLRRNDGSTPDAAFRHGTGCPKRQPSIQVTVTDRGPFTGAFLDLSPAAASALGCRCTHRSVIATVVQMGSGGTVVASRGRQSSVAAAAMPQFFSPTDDVMRPLGTFGSSMAMASAPRPRRHGGHR